MDWEVSDETAPFWAAAADGRLTVQRCPDTGRLIWPPRPMSPWGSRRAPEWTDVSGHGRIWSYIVPHPPVLPDFADVAPYNVIVVEMDEDPTIRMVGNLVAGDGASINSVDPSTITIGEPVEAVFDEEVTKGRRLVRWIRASDLG